MGQEEDLIHKHNIMTITYYDKVYTCTTWAIINLDDATNVWDVSFERFVGVVLFLAFIFLLRLMAISTNK